METYGFTIEFKRKEESSWENHWNHKIYPNKQEAESSIKQVRGSQSYYRNNYDWRVVELFTSISKD